MKNGKGILVTIVGVLTLQDESVYNGDFLNDMRNGHGIYYLHSIGVMKSPNGDKYDGEWKDDKKNGKGIINSTYRNDSLPQWRQV